MVIWRLSGRAPPSKLRVSSIVTLFDIYDEPLAVSGTLGGVHTIERHWVVFLVRHPAVKLTATQFLAIPAANAWLPLHWAIFRALCSRWLLDTLSDVQLPLSPIKDTQASPTRDTALMLTV